MTQDGSSSEPGYDVTGNSHGAPSPQSACHAGADAEARWPLLVGDLVRAPRRRTRRTCDCQCSRKSVCRSNPVRTARKCRFIHACRPKWHRFRVWRRWPRLASARRRSILTIWWRSAQCSGIAASRGWTAVVSSPCIRTQESCPCQKEIRDVHDGVDFSPPEGPFLLRASA